MPIYEYTCQDCAHIFSKRRSMSDADAPIACPECGRDNAKRALSLFATTGASRDSGAANMGSACSSCSATSCSTCGH